MPWLSTLGVASGVMTATWSIIDLFEGKGSSQASRGVRELPTPSPAPGPSPQAPAPGPAPEIGDPLRPEGDSDSPSSSGGVEEEVETYGPNGEWLGTEHGTLEQ